MDKETVSKLKYLIKKKKSVEEIKTALGLKETYMVYGLVEILVQEGCLYDIINGEVVELKTPRKTDDVYSINSKEDKLRLLLISDTHLCSKYDRLDILRYLYDKAESRGIKHIIHSGDFTDGRSTRPEHAYELKELSYEGQVDYCVDKYPEFSGKTYVISGNHDDWWYKSAGSGIIKSIAKQRDDIIYLGADVATMKIGKTKIHLFHGKGSQAYAKSYKAQKYLETIPIEEKPDILQLGHIHQAFYYQQDYTHVFQTGCLEDPTPFVRSMGLNGERSCWWVDAYVNEKGHIDHIEQELESFGPKLIRKK